MSKTVIVASFKAGGEEHKVSLPYNMTFQQWSNISETEYKILIDHIGEQIKLYKKTHNITAPTTPDSIEFAPHFYGVE